MGPVGIYTYEKYYFRMFSLLFAFMTITFLARSEFIGGAISLIGGVLISFSYQGIIIDPDKQLYLKYDRFLWIKIGRWTPFSTPSYVTIVRINLSSKRDMPSPMALPDDRRTARSYKVNLVVEGEERYIPICRGALEAMTSEALKLGSHLHIRVLDFTTSDKKWIL